MTRDIKPLVPVDPRGLDDIANSLLEASSGTTADLPKGRFSLEDQADFYRINGVSYRDGIYQVDLLKALLDNPASKTQDQWAEYSEQAQKQNGFYVASLPLYHSLFASLFRSKNSKDKDEIEQAREFLKDKLLKHWLITLTRIRYNPKGKDLVIHNYGLKDQYQVQEDIIGKNEWVKNASNPSAYRAILGTQDIDEINKVYNWITGKDAYLWRVNNKPKKIDERIARFSADPGWVDLYCNGGPGDSNRALGVRARREN